MYVRGHRFDFSPSILNNYLGCHDHEGPMIQPVIQRVVLVITKDRYSAWPDKGNGPSFVLSTKFSILHKIGIFNWFLDTHKYHLTKVSTSLIFLIGTKQTFNLGRLMFEHILRHAEYDVQKLGLITPPFLGFLWLKMPPFSLVLTVSIKPG